MLRDVTKTRLEENTMTIQITYEIDTSEDGQPRVILSHDGQHIGSLWGTVLQNTSDDFERENGIIHIHHNNKRIATLWDTQLKPQPEPRIEECMPLIHTPAQTHQKGHREV